MTQYNEYKFIKSLGEDKAKKILGLLDTWMDYAKDEVKQELYHGSKVNKDADVLYWKAIQKLVDIKNGFWEFYKKYNEDQKYADSLNVAELGEVEQLYVDIARKAENN
ncbi:MULTISPECIES: hypothetical protein [unclassified Mycoplasma]|uniref:hypothetical protein n=1 Tax=unclassified Mycoplasma TaxID=2683645 RepID=UPI00216B53F9|nr:MULTISPECIES: hypothetical protein [unclassified Mycoplasma]MCS4537161.1 hypothetical protein [Mycoplasma sp. CSL7475-4]MCT4470009.1 hypothetical protein [Mycoplasma sp. HS2188]